MRTALVSALILSSSCGAIDEGPVRQHHALVGGAEAGPEQLAVVKLTIGCTGTVLAPNVVLTARHCVSALPAGAFYCDENGGPVDGGGEVPQYGATIDPTTIMIEANGSSTNPRLPNASTSPRGSMILVPAETNRCKTDVALIVLDPPIDDPVIAPVQLEAVPAVGATLTAVGWGLSEVAGSLTAPRQRDVSVLAIGPRAGATPDDAVWDHFFTVSEGLCYGDSGSPGRAASGAVVGVASFINFTAPPTTMASDCASAGISGGYAALMNEKAFITQGFATANATPWLDGQPNPRDALAPFEGACTTDADCQSNACVAHACTHGCANVVTSTPCPAGYTCELIADRQRCVQSSAPDAGTDPTPSEPTGCSSAPVALLWLGVLALRTRARH